MHNQCEFFVCLFLCKEEVYGVSVKTVPDVRWKKDPLGYCFVHCGTSGVTPQRLKQLPTRPWSDQPQSTCAFTSHTDVHLYTILEKMAIVSQTSEDTKPHINNQLCFLTTVETALQVVWQMC